MGHTHYWRQTSAMSDDLRADIEAILAHSPVPVAGWDGTGQPEVTATTVRLNGVAPVDCETFTLGNQAGVDDCCKTAGLPYDLVVTAILIAAQVRGVAEVDSDGYYEDWTDAIFLFECAVRHLTATETDALRSKFGTRIPTA